MKTVVNQIIEHIESRIEKGRPMSNYLYNLLNGLKLDIQDKFIRIEKNQTVDAYNDGFKDGCNTNNR